MSLFSKLVVIGVVQIVGDANVTGVEGMERNLLSEAKQGLAKYQKKQQKGRFQRGSKTTRGGQRRGGQRRSRIGGFGQSIMNQSTLNTTAIPSGMSLGGKLTYRPGASTLRSSRRKTPNFEISNGALGFQKQVFGKGDYNQQKYKTQRQKKAQLDKQIKDQLRLLRKQPFKPKVGFGQRLPEQNRYTGLEGIDAEDNVLNRKMAGQRAKKTQRNIIAKAKRHAKKQAYQRKHFKCSCNQESCRRSGVHSQHNHQHTQPKVVITDLKDMDKITTCPTQAEFAQSGPNEWRCVHHLQSGKFFGNHKIVKTKNGFVGADDPHAWDPVEETLFKAGLSSELKYLHEQRPGTATTKASSGSDRSGKFA